MIKGMATRFLDRLGYKIVRKPPSETKLAAEVVERGKAIIRRISPNLEVLNGAFKGMKYPSLDISEAALVPKIVGSYESQLGDILQVIFKTPYSDVMDVGCAEGYYAVGMAKHMPHAVLHAYDINERDLEFCRRMAELNQVKNIAYNNFCDANTLINFNFGKKGLIFCDCEGYELELFSPEVVRALFNKNVDVLVEMHDVLVPGISSRLLLRFKDTHDIRLVSTNDRKNFSWSGLEKLTDSERAFAVFEHRGGVGKDVYMEWAYFTVKQK